MISPDIVIETLPFRVSSAQYFGIIARKLLQQWWSFGLLLLVGMITATCYDLRFGIVLLMFLFLIVPLILFMVYYNYALRPEAFYSVVEKIAIIDFKGINCLYDEQQRCVLQWDRVNNVVFTHDAFMIYTDTYTYFYIPRDAFADNSSLKDFEQLLRSVIS